MRLRTCSFLALFLFLFLRPGFATVLSSVHGVVHDAQHFPVAGAQVTLKSDGSSFTLQTITNAEGSFDLPTVPIGVYRLHVTAQGFAEVEEIVTVQSSTHSVLHVALQMASVKTIVTVDAPTVQVDSVTPTTFLTRAEIDQTPGALRPSSYAIVTDYVPGAYITHDMLHMRGGHQTSWLIDGVSIPNTNIASNVGPQIDPRDMDSLEIQRGSYAADVGDRTYGVFNVLPRNGFERDREGELLISGGNFQTGDAQLSLGNHTSDVAWYASASGSRSA
jgi:hypothetical protein